MARIYLDWAATAPPAPDIIERAGRIALESFGNPSSSHEEGRSAESILSASRVRLAAALGVAAKAVVFTSGGTESNNIVVNSLLGRPRGGEIVASGIEHSSIYEPVLYLAGLGFRVHWVGAEPSGAVDAGKIASALGPQTALVALMHVNNETGAIQPIAETARAVRDAERRFGRQIHFHCDGVQALGKIPADYTALDVDSASFSAHKIGGMRGAGALYLRRELPLLFRGGGQEAGRRPGTENLPAIWSFAEAASGYARTLEEHRRHACELRRLLVEGVERIAGARFVPADAGRREEDYSPYILSVAFPPLPGEALVRVLDDAGCAVSTGSACSSKRVKERRVLTNIGIDGETSRSAIRISIGPATSAEEIERFLALLRKEVSAWSMPLRA